ncbi:hypothetical protein BDZ85DRAFT_13103 [Elsinoe ampelina]|uniref:Uncharacterized protein n=1 Tax=Elsinoe ampelina TaxID=302913 RepID=A0A6A6GR25_9PEZI|nr:hypothetical protein BDZ85DRAFT_13103 [Elsinoe ampelina]
MSAATPLRLAARRAVIPRRPLGHRSGPRFQSSSRDAGHHTSHLLAGLAGGTMVLLGGYTLYRFSGPGRLHAQLNKSAKTAQDYYKTATTEFQKSTPDANEAIEYLRRTAYSYAAFLPGGRGYVDTVFKDIDTVREQHSDKLEEIVKEGYEKLQDISKEVSKDGLSIAAASSALGVLQESLKKIAGVSTNALGSIIDNHPQLKDSLGGSIDQLKSMSESLGPEAKEKLDKVWSEITTTLSGGINSTSISKVKKIIENQTQELQKYSDQAWQTGLKQISPYLEKNPKLKELVESNAEALKKGDVSQLFQKVKSGIDSGDFDELKKYVEQTVQQAGQAASGGFDDMLKWAKPYLDRRPKLRELVEENAEALKKGDTKKLWRLVENSTSDRGADELKRYVEDLTRKGSA